MKRLLALVVFAFSVNPGMVQAGGSPPTDVSVNFDIDAGAGCDFPVNWMITGKSSTINLPGGGFISTGPKLRAVVTNLDNSQSVTLNVQGAGHVSFGPQGEMMITITGRNLLGDPVANTMLLAIGTFHFIPDPNTNALLDLSGEGQLIDVCAMID